MRACVRACVRVCMHVCTNTRMQFITKLLIRLSNMLNYTIPCNEGVEDCNFRCLLICLYIIFTDDTAQ